MSNKIKAHTNAQPRVHAHKCGNSISKQVDAIVQKEFKNNKYSNKIEEIDPEINFKLNSFNLAIGPQGSSKTVSVMKELMKLSAVPHNYHLMIYVTDVANDVSFNALCKYINFQIIKTDYEHIEEEFERLMELKQYYNQMVDGEIEPDESILDALYIDDFSRKRLHTFILFDDAAFIFDKKSKSKFKRHLTELRHLNVTAYFNLQIWSSVDPKLKNLLTSVMLFGGFSRERVQQIFRQLPLDLRFDDFYKNYYMKLKQYEKLVIDFPTHTIKIV